MYRAGPGFCHNPTMTVPIADTSSSPPAADATPLDTIRQWGQELGFQALGFTGIDLAQHRDYLPNGWKRATTVR